MIDLLSLLKLRKAPKRTAGQIAKERLKLVLIHDRSDCSGELLENIRKDIMEVLSKYMEIDMDALDIQISTTKLDENDDKEVPALYANIPIKNIKHLADTDTKKEDDKKQENETKESKEVKEEINASDDKKEEKDSKTEDVKEENKDKKESK